MCHPSLTVMVCDGLCLFQVNSVYSSLRALEVYIRRASALSDSITWSSLAICYSLTILLLYGFSLIQTLLKYCGNAAY